MDRSEVQSALSKIEQQLAGAGALEPVVEQAIEELLNLVERLVSGQQALAQEVQRLKEQLEQKKKDKTTDKDDGSEQNTDHSSEKRRRKGNPSKASSAHDRRTFKDLTPFLSIWAKRSSVPSIGRNFRPMRCVWKTKK